jgi:dephospho-CoA kinase
MKNPSTRNYMLSVGITGGIGSGKTTVCKTFESLGIPVYYSDDRAKYLMQHEHFLIDQIKKEFGEEVYDNGILQREKLASIVFGNDEKLRKLNALVHPVVFRDTERWTEEQRTKDIPYCIKEAALLIETGSYKNLDKLIVVTAPKNVRVKRIIERDHTNDAEVNSRINSQMSDDEKIILADFVINNQKGIDELKNEVLKVHEQILALLHDKK